MRYVFMLALWMGLSGLGVQAQKLSYSVTAGWGASRAEDVSAFHAFNLGAKADWYAFGEDKYSFVQAGLLFASKGWKDDVFSISEPFSCTQKCRLYYLEVPVHVGYTFSLGERTSLITTVGPYAAVGLGGKNKAWDIKSKPFKDGEYKRFDCGLGADVTLEYNRLQFGVGASFGLLRQTTDKWRMMGKLRHRTILVSLGYRLR